MALHDYNICVATLVDTLYSTTAYCTWITLEDCTDFDDLKAQVEHLIDTSPARLLGKLQGSAFKQSRSYLISDVEGFAQGLITESSSLEHVWSLWEEVQQAIVDDVEQAFNVYLEDNGADTYSAFQDRYLGHYESEEDYARELLDDTGALSVMPEYIRGYFDYEAFARDLFITDVTMIDGYVFSNF